jgi:drug/metabolite transporter (DMT)-like permease
MLIFSASLPATRIAVSAFSPIFLTSLRALIAAGLAGILLLIFRPTRPERSDLTSLVLVAFGVVIGFPLLTALALQHINAAHSVVFTGLLPLSTAVFAVLRGGERPQPLFWLFAVLGSSIVAGFALLQAEQGDAGSLQGAILMILAIIVCGLGYAEGAKISRHLGGWQVISWALVLASPFMAIVTFANAPAHLDNVSMPVWFSLGYVSSFSMLIGFVFWYRGLALGGAARVGQLQLLQPFFGLLIAAVVLGESVAVSMLGVTVCVCLCVFAGKRFA